MSEANRDSDVYDGFLLAIRAFCQAHDVDVPGTEDHKLYDLLREVAEGTTTLTDSPAEKELKYPKMSEELKRSLAANTNRLMEKDRELAKRVLTAMERAM